MSADAAFGAMRARLLVPGARPTRDDRVTLVAWLRALAGRAPAGELVHGPDQRPHPNPFADLTHRGWAPWLVFSDGRTLVQVPLSTEDACFVRSLFFPVAHCFFRR